MRVLNFCHYLQGPAAMQYLADMGAEVIKIEPPKGAFERHWAGAGTARVGGVSALYLAGNRNVLSIAVDLKHPEATDVVHRLIGRTHVLAENYRPGTLDRLGLGYEQVKARKPDIIYASASGFGSTGPLVRRPGQDLLVQAMSGLARATGDGRVPVPVGLAAVDQHGAALMALSITGAYAKWQATGLGTRVESSLFSAAIDLQNESIVTYHAAGLGSRSMPRDPHLATWYHEAPYGVYAVKDAFVALSMTKVEALADALNSDRLKALVDLDPFVERDIIASETADVLREWSFDALSEALDSGGIWFARVEDYEDLAANPQAAHNGAFQTMPVNDAQATLVSHPVSYNGEVPGIRTMALSAGADTRSVLENAGFDGSEVADLIRNNVVFTPDDAA
ncbi:CaiB/BaiF CoA transferase family protein [Aureimonas fodinaquatilis]|nr:CaiB/BaiF CoA-transferase family protein [Aureimonas fodinaquatilis]